MAILRQSLLLLAALLLVSGCSTVAVTGRTQMNMVKESDLITMSDLTYNAFTMKVKEANLELKNGDNPLASNYIASTKKVCNALIDASELRNKYNWDILIIKSTIPNACVLPNGKIIVSTAIFPIAQTEAGLATVISHEIAHVAAHHQEERLSQALVAQFSLRAADTALIIAQAKTNANPNYRPIVDAALGLGVSYGFILPFSRLHESEADRIGLFYMAKAGYDPTEAVSFWERMEASQGQGKNELLSTHPSSSTRISDIRRWLPEVQVYYADRTKPLPSNLTQAKAALDEQTSRKEAAPIALQPEPRSGYWEKFKMSDSDKILTKTIKTDVDCEVGTCIQSLFDNGTEALADSHDLSIIKFIYGNGSWMKFSPGIQLIHFPLMVGDSWSRKVTIESSTGKKEVAQMKADVVDYEPVTVTAGTFMTYKIIVSLGGTRFQEVWFAPEARSSVKATTFSPKGNITLELLDYQKPDGEAL